MITGRLDERLQTAIWIIGKRFETTVKIGCLFQDHSVKVISYFTESLVGLLLALLMFRLSIVAQNFPQNSVA